MKKIVATVLVFISFQTIADEPWFEVKQSIQPVYRSFEGQVEAIHQSTVSAQTSGRVAEIHYDVDDFVEAGGVLIEFTNTEQKQALQRAQANLESAEATEKEALANYNRVKETFDRKLIAKSDYDLALSKKNAATAAVKAQKAAVETAATQLEYTLVKAPFAGIVTSRHVEKGETVNVGTPIMSGLSLDHLRIITQIPESLISQIKSHPLAKIKLPNQQTVESTDITVFPYADSQSRTFELRVNLPEKTAGLFPGMSTSVAFQVGSKETLLIPKDAVIRRGELVLVYVKHENKKLPRQVITGSVDDDSIEILSGLKPGDLIVRNPLP